ncbi:MAG: hypothetical protein AB2693_32975 [Candidatus Thiodiazotropha sp.]
MEYVETLRISLNEGYLFPVRDKHNKVIINKPMSSSLITDRLLMHLRAINLYEGETSHSTRRGCAIMLRMLGIGDDKINKHIEWGRSKMINHNANIGNLCGPSGVARQLSDAAQHDASGSSELSEIAKHMYDLHSLKRFYFGGNCAI